MVKVHNRPHCLQQAFLQLVNCISSQIDLYCVYYNNSYYFHQYFWLLSLTENVRFQSNTQVFYPFSGKLCIFTIYMYVESCDYINFGILATSLWYFVIVILALHHWLEIVFF